MGIKEEEKEISDEQKKHTQESKIRRDLQEINSIEEIDKDKSNYIRIDFNYSKTKGKLTQSLIDEIEYMFNQKRLPVKIELIQNGIIVFINHFSKKFLDFMTKNLEKVKQDNLPEKHAKWYISATDELFYTRSTEMSTIELYKRIKREIKEIKNLSHFFEKFD